jgi:hypothetical protein
MDMAMSPPCRPCSSLSSPLHSPPWPPRHSSPPLSPTLPSTGQIDRNAVTTPHHARPKPHSMPLVSHECTRGHVLDTRSAAATHTPWTPSLRHELRHLARTPPDTRRALRKRRSHRHRRRFPANAAADLDAMRRHQTVPHLASKRSSTAMISPTSRAP